MQHKEIVEDEEYQMQDEGEEEQEEVGFKHLISDEEKEKLINLVNQNLTHQLGLWLPNDSQI